MASSMGRSKLQAPSSTSRPTVQPAGSSKLSRPSTLSRPATAGAASRIAARPVANSTINRPSWNDSTVSSIPDSDLSTIQADEDSTQNMTSSASLGSLSMSRTTKNISIGSQRNTSSTMNMSKKTTPPRTADNTYTVNNKSSGGSNGLDIVKNVEDVIARNKILEEENNVLRSLIHEESDRGEASFDERRILMLKCQIYQLEKQINILSKSLAFRKHAHTEALNTIAMLADTFRTKLASSAGSMTAASTFSVDRAELTRWTELAESTRLKLIKSEEADTYDNDKESISEPSLLTSTFSKTGSHCQLLDVCSGNLDHINLKQVGVLESSLGKLYGKLCRLKECLQTNAFDSTMGGKDTKEKAQQKSTLLPLHRDNLKSQLEECCSMTQSTCGRLFDLMLLVPSAPWAATKTSPIDKLTQETLLTKLKSLSLPKSKYPAVEVLLKSYHIASNYHHHMRANELAAKDEELQFYRSSYQVQRDYIQAVMELFRSKYEAFLGELRENLNVPLRALIDKFWQMKAEASEVNLKEFLGYFKHYAKKFEEVIACIEQMPNNDLIGNTFSGLLVQLDKEVDRLNAHCQASVQQLSLNKIDLEQLSRESDQIFGEVISITPKDSPTDDSPLPLASMANLVDFV